MAAENCFCLDNGHGEHLDQNLSDLLWDAIRIHSEPPHHIANRLHQLLDTLPVSDQVHSSAHPHHNSNLEATIQQILDINPYERLQEILNTVQGGGALSNSPVQTNDSAPPAANGDTERPSTSGTQIRHAQTSNY